MQQDILQYDDMGNNLREYLIHHQVKRIFLVCGDSFMKSVLWSCFQEMKEENNIEIVTFRDFSPNPNILSVEKGKKRYLEKACDAIVAAGGGSSMDVAKCIKSSLPVPPILFLAIPTTAGSGSEATRYAVVYEHGEKKSITEESSIPDAVYFDERLLSTLPLYQKKATVLDALCHGIESYWSINSTKQSKEYSKLSIQLILDHIDAYLDNRESVGRMMFMASNFAGKAINITQTTAGHAMCYKLTQKYGYAHGHAAALCNVWLWHYMISHLEDCVDGRGREYLEQVFGEIAEVMGCNTVYEAVGKFQGLVEKMELPHIIEPSDIPELSSSVHLERLKNNPVHLERDAMMKIYTAISEWRMPGKEK